ncbi:MAG: hypothetical protein R3Y43_05290 [Alphaproteobacteria bacterium]
MNKRITALKTLIAAGGVAAGTATANAQAPQEDVKETISIANEASVTRYENSGVSYTVQEVERNSFHKEAHDLRPDGYSALQESGNEDILTFNIAGSFCRITYHENDEIFLQVEKGSQLAAALKEAPLDLEEASINHPIKRLHISEALQKRSKECTTSLSFENEAAKYIAMNQKMTKGI